MPFYNTSYREAAEQARQVAVRMTDPVRKAMWRRIAENYEAMAAQDAAAARAPVPVKPKRVTLSRDHR